MKSGIYTITCLVDGKIYLGYSKNLGSRLSTHLSHLKSNKHHNIHLQGAFNKYGENNFRFEILEEYPNEGFILPSMEHWWANMLNVHNDKYGYNIEATHPLNKVIISESQRKALSNAKKGLFGIKHPNSKPVIKIDKITLKEIEIYEGLSDAQRKTGILSSNISNMLSGRSKSAGGFKWKYFIKN